MKIIFVYFDFEYGGKHPEGYRGFHQCELNFSTNYTYSLMREENICRINRIPLPENQKIEPGFWTDPRIYNITAIVGDNGSGKTTLLHALLRACLMNSEVDFEFVVLLEPENSEENNNLRLYTNMNCEFMATNINIEQTQEYPKELMKTKFMLLDNTLSFSDIELVNELESDYIYDMDPHTENDFKSPPVSKQKKQFFNESYISSLCYSNYISSKNHMAVITEQIVTHFRYETYQEIRYIFDKYQRNTLLNLKENYNVPLPQYLMVSVMVPEISIPDILNTIRLDKGFDNVEELRSLEKIYYLLCFFRDKSQQIRNDLAYDLCVNCLANYLFWSSYQVSSLEGLKNEQFEIPADIMKFDKDAFIDFINQCNAMLPEEHSEEPCQASISFIEFIAENEKLIRDKFIHIGGFEYRVEINEEIDDFMVTFINKYRAICGIHYFLTFSWGMSSGESNLLRMFTKFRYLLDGPIYYDDSDNIQCNAHNVIVNKFNDEDETICDSLIILIDEADLSYHPEWQRSFITLLTAFLPKLYKDPYYEGIQEGCKNIQIILTTHSPLMLGDFPMASVIYLKKDNGDDANNRDNGIVKIEKSLSKNPFGQNLYTILKDGFYMKHTMGELAHLKLKDVIEGLSCIRNYLDERKTLDDECVSDILDKLKRYQKTIHHLPDGIIREKMQQEINDCREKINHTNLHILLRRKKELMNELDDVNNAIKEQEGRND